MGRRAQLTPSPAGAVAGASGLQALGRGSPASSLPGTSHPPGPGAAHGHLLPLLTPLPAPGPGRQPCTCHRCSPACPGPRLPVGICHCSPARPGPPPAPIRRGRRRPVPVGRARRKGPRTGLWGQDGWCLGCLHSGCDPSLPHGAAALEPVVAPTPSHHSRGHDGAHGVRVWRPPGPPQVPHCLSRSLEPQLCGTWGLTSPGPACGAEAARDMRGETRGQGPRGDKWLRKASGPGGHRWWEIIAGGAEGRRATCKVLLRVGGQEEGSRVGLADQGRSLGLLEDSAGAWGSGGKAAPWVPPSSLGGAQQRPVPGSPRPTPARLRVSDKPGSRSPSHPTASLPGLLPGVAEAGAWGLPLGPHAPAEPPGCQNL